MISTWNFSAVLRSVAASLAIAFVCVGALVASCTDGTTPDCTGDAAAACGPYPNEGGNDSNISDSPTDVVVDSPAVDTGANNGVDSGTEDAGNEDSGEAGDGG